MGITYDRNTARLTEFVTVEDAEGLLEWLQAKPKRKVDLSGCQHLHAANLQVLMALRPNIAALPADAALASWLRGALDIK